MTEKELKTLIKDEIQKQYNMNPYQFSLSDYPAKIGVSDGNTFRCYLTSSASSLPFYKKMCTFLKLGELEKRKKVVKEIDFIVKPVSGDEAVPKRRRVLGSTTSAPAARTPRIVGKKA